GGVETRSQCLLRDSAGFEPARGDLGGDLIDRVDDLGPASVVDAELERQARVGLGHLVRGLELIDDRPPQTAPTAGPHDAPPAGVELVPPTSGATPVEPRGAALFVA